MKVRLYRMSLGGALSMIYLITATYLLVSCGSVEGGQEIVRALGFPMLYATGFITELCSENFGWDSTSPRWQMAIKINLWIANAYLWGHILAHIIRRFASDFSRKRREWVGD